MIAASYLMVPLVGLAANLLMALGSYGIAAAGLRQPRGLPRWLATAVVFWSAATIGLELLGSVGAIGTYPILAWAGLVAGTGVSLWWPRGPGPSADRSGTQDAPAGWEAVVSLALVLVLALIFGIPSLFGPVKVVSDGPIYHLYFAARWWKAGRLILVASPFGENAAPYFPANGDLWFTWLMATWGGDTFAKVGQAPFQVLASASAYGCARLLGVGRSAGTIAACWFVSSTPLVLYAFEPNVDYIFVAGYLLAAYFFLRYACVDGGMPALVLGALAAGGALGTKAVAIVFVPPLIALVIAGLLLQRSPRRVKLLRIAIVAILPMATGGFWYLRNAWLTGNPLYPLDVRIMGRTIWAGWYGPEAMRTSQFYLPRGDWRALGDLVLVLLDPRLAPVWFAAILGAWAVGNARTRPYRPWIALFAIMAVLNVALFWIVIPYRTQPRFMHHALGLAVVPVAALLDRSRWLRLGATALLAVHIVTPQSWPFPTRESAIPWDMTPLVPNAVHSLLGPFPWIEPDYPARPADVTFRPHLILVAVLMVGAWQRTCHRRSPRGTWAWPIAATTLTLAFLWIGSKCVDPDYFDPALRFYAPFREYYVGWRVFEVRCGPRGVRVAYAGNNLPYYLLGRGLRNEVRYVNIDRHRDWLMHDYHREALARGEGPWPNSRPAWDRIHPDERAWLDNLDAEGIQLLVVTRPNSDEGVHIAADTEGFPIERRWADSHPERFVPLYGREELDPWFKLYRVLRPRRSP